ncbi:CaiB/BaiF CoA-transferase family protein [Mycolicibacterium sp. F2034L]|uniref:CaiB/BaiF CoA transferase family protein n=1 Tax=Mycolicibacterium sp. F2034L TaxID=2926422 RepID=UPI001FF62EE2|nr:CoA transferase [Mycolicibacterium sp. F2034L]MCK0176856.1 CoA transferase [Mycolicibacterium sp. F2034L]
MSALTGLRVVEIAESVAGEYCGKLLADFGADVVKVERPVIGSPTRAMAPRVGDGPDGSVVFGYLNTGKRSVELDLAAPDGRRDLHRMIAEADAVVDDHGAAWLVAAQLTPSEVAEHHPGVVFCTVTPYGLGAEGDWQKTASLTVFHSSGWGHHTPSHADPDLPPLKGPGRFLADYEAGLDAALCVASALLHRLRSGAGEFIDVSAQAALVSRADCILGRFIAGDVDPELSRDDYDQQGPASFFACADGFVYLYVTNSAHWRGVKELLGHPDWLERFDDDWLEFSVTAEKVQTFRAGFAEWVHDLPRTGVSERAQRAGVPLVPVNDASDLLVSPQYHHRAFFRTVTHPVFGAVSHPTVPYRMSGSPAQIDSAAPALGTDATGGAFTRARPAPIAARDRTPYRVRGGPLQGVRIVELTKVWAGPYAGKLLAFLGAEVIKVETSTHPEEMRAYGGTDVDHAPYFLSINPEILSVDLDIKSPAGMDRLRELIARSDVVINNLRPGAMERGGLGYDALGEIRDDIISVSIKMWGNDGPLGYQTGYAPCFAALSGLAALVGYPGGGPLGASMRYGDSTVGAATALATVAALIHRDLTGEGQFVDVSAVETLSSMVGDSLFEHTVTGRALTPDGNRHADMAPHGCYPCADAEWLSLAVRDDKQWLRLCEVLDADRLREDPRFTTTAARLSAVEELDALLCELTRRESATVWATRLHAAGVPSAKSANVVDVLGDQRLWDRECFRFVSDHREGQRPVLGTSWRLSVNPVEIGHGAPRLGEHNDAVFGAD